MMLPTAEPRIRAGSLRTSQPAIGAAITPPASGAGVPIGPQPPPPAASMKPANPPSGTSANHGSGLAPTHESSTWRGS